jgi:hypothetical protein
MKKSIILTAAAALMIFAASCGETAPKQQSNADGAEEQQTAITVKKITEKDLPTEISYQDDFVEGYRYTDKTGDNIVFITEGEVTEWGRDKDGYILSNKDLRAYRFLKTDNEWEEVWRVYDMEFECFHYPVAEFVKGAFSITDLNNDGIAEIWMIYVKSCLGGVDPANMYLRMYNDENIFTMTGETKIIFTDGYSIGGEYEIENLSPHKTPPEFVEYAKELWKKHITGNYK